MARLTSTALIVTAALALSSTAITLAYSGAIAMYNTVSFPPLPPHEKVLQYSLVRLIYNAVYYGSKGTDTALYVVNATASDIAAAVTGWSGYLDTVHAFWDSHGLMDTEFDTYWEPHNIYGVIDGTGDIVWDNDIYNFQFTDFHPAKLAVVNSCHQGHEIRKRLHSSVDAGGLALRHAAGMALHNAIKLGWLQLSRREREGIHRLV